VQIGILLRSRLPEENVEEPQKGLRADRGLAQEDKPVDAMRLLGQHKILSAHVVQTCVVC
jgi:hypothetical protein